MKAFNIYLNNKLLDTVHYNDTFTYEEVKQSLIDHDGFASSIVVTGEVITRAEYMQDSTALHTIYYNQYASEDLKAMLRKHPVYNECKQSNDKYYNNVRTLSYWDMLGTNVHRTPLLATLGESFSLAHKVCVVKACIRYMIANEV